MDPVKATKEEKEWVGELPEDRAEEKALVRKVDLLLLPSIWLMYLFSYADRTKYVFSTVLDIRLGHTANCEQVLGTQKLPG